MKRKGMLKKLIVLSLALATLTTTVVGLTGCNNNDERTLNDVQYSEVITHSNEYIVVHENDVDTLHKGDVIERAWNAAHYGWAALTPILRFNCGRRPETYQYVVYPQGCPSKDKYDEVCDCAYEISLRS